MSAKRRPFIAAYEFVMHNPQQGHEVMSQAFWPWAKSMLAAGHQLRVSAGSLEDHKTDAQRRFLHGVVFKAIAEQVVVDGRRFPLAVWKEYYREKFLGFKTVSIINPVTGKKMRRRQRISTEDLSVKEYAQHIEKVTADAVTAHGVWFPPDYLTIDPETGEIYDNR